MPRVKQPSAEDVIEAVRRVSAEIGNYQDGQLDSVEVVARLYDRRSGNFKASGWLVELGYVSDEGQLEFAQFMVRDEDVPRMVQATL